MNKDSILDIIQHTHGLGVVELVKISGTEQETLVAAIADDKSVIVSGTFNQPLEDFIGVFGMPNLSKLKTIVGFDDYDKDALISVTRNTRDGEEVPVAIHFETKNGDFVNDYRLMAKVTIEDKVRPVTFKGTGWNVEFNPSLAGILRLKKQASANNDEAHFTTKTENGDLKIFFGDHSTHSGNFVFHPSVDGTLSRAWQWPVKVFLSIMDLPGDKTIKLSDQGAASIEVNSGLATWTYLLPASSK